MARPRIPSLPILILFALSIGLSSYGGSTSKAAEASNDVAAAVTPTPKAEPVEEDTTAVEEPTDTATATAGTEPAPDMPDATDTSNNANKSDGQMAERTVNEERLGIILDLISQDLEA